MTPGAQERADQLLDDLMDHRTYDRCDWDTREEAIALVLAYCAEEVAQAVQAGNRETGATIWDLAAVLLETGMPSDALASMARKNAAALRARPTEP